MKLSRIAAVVSLPLAFACSGEEAGRGLAMDGSAGPTGGDATPILSDAATDGPDAEVTTAVTPPPAGERHSMLSDWNLFSDIESQTPNGRVIPYLVRSSLFSDYTVKHRFLWIPEDTTIGYQDEDVWEYPVGTVLVKTFTYPEDLRDPGGPRRLLETRLLVRETALQWEPHVYVFEDSQADAARKSAGDTLPATWIHLDGQTRSNDYGVPENNACEKCHGAAEQLDTLGGRTRQMNHSFDYGSGPENQIDHLAFLGMLDRTPPPSSERQTLVDPFGNAQVSDRARSYLDANCAHCHSPDRLAGGSNFLLDFASTDPATGDPTNWGVCKVPTSAGQGSCGFVFDVVPGDPDQSILICRVESRDIAFQMPSLATNIPHDEGAALLREWIAAMAPAPCN